MVSPSLNLSATQSTSTEFHRPKNPMPAQKLASNHTRAVDREQLQEVDPSLHAPKVPLDKPRSLPNDYMELISNTTYFSITFL